MRAIYLFVLITGCSSAVQLAPKVEVLDRESKAPDCTVVGHLVAVDGKLHRRNTCRPEAVRSQNYGSEEGALAAAQRLAAKRGADTIHIREVLVTESVVTHQDCYDIAYQVKFDAYRCGPR